MKKTVATAVVASILGVAWIAPVQAAPLEKERAEASRYIDDVGVTTGIKGRLAEDKLVSALSIGVETRDGMVQLSGFVPTHAEKARAAQIARSVEGAKLVQNDIIVHP